LEICSVQIEISPIFAYELEISTSQTIWNNETTFPPNLKTTNTSFPRWYLVYPK
jgi:hypothetical protein